MRAKAAGVFVIGVFGLVLASSGIVAQGCGGGGSSTACTIASEGCPCTGGGTCDPGLECKSNVCVDLTGGGPDGGGAGTGGGNASAMCDTFTGYCAKLNECAPALVKLNYGSVEECSTRFAIACKDAVNAPGSGLTAAAITGCVAALPGATCEDLIYRKVAACNAKGTRTNGMACGTNEQCTTGYCTQSASACGVCSALVAAGDACMVTDDCEPGLECSADNHCVVPGTAGTVCSETQGCKYGLYCKPASAGAQTGSCVNAAKDPGLDCTKEYASSCNILKGIFCDSASGKCANLGFVAPGEPCGLVSGKFVFCSKGECAYPDATATQGTCGALAADGASCGATTACEIPAECISGKCKLPSSSACL